MGNYIRWVYDAEGNKLRKITKTGTAAATTTDYASGIEYRGTALDAIYHSEGRVKYTGTTPRYEYTLSDHLGNGRVYYTDLNNNGAGDITDIIQDNHYYPFGLNHTDPRRNAGNPVNLYQYNGKELVEDNGLGWSHYGARAYDAAVGRWWVVDPLAEIAMSKNSYMYAKNNPIGYVDIGGLYYFPVAGYPKFSKFLQGNDFLKFMKQDGLILNGLAALGGLDPKSMDALVLSTNSSAISIEVNSNPCGLAGANGCTQGGNIQISTELLNAFENANPENESAALMNLLLTIIHETVHAGRQRGFSTQNSGPFQWVNPNKQIIKYGETVLGKADFADDRIPLTSEQGNILEEFLRNANLRIYNSQIMDEYKIEPKEKNEEDIRP